ncbi:glutamyl-tRNA reductase [Pajaroellobacter abortibovis]|uniref:Glutamyl-tRNA reductase n=1 Tax=Pajaroellobacter abortibovis TaxID=1882918 RepID=A0A1L6MV49_9BACT|nr:glutamyl-tRNA reductase [Pajaroellobacter abortibovis]APR99394.1 glutamyl-tRNA reductase [Pajaroellobacter abortibovis]
MIILMGLSHHTASLQVREKLVIDTGALSRVLLQLKSRKEIGEAVILSTCNRFEVYAYAHRGIEKAKRAIGEVIAALNALPPCLYERGGNAAIRHLFRVACSLDSMVVGEPQILGQVKNAYEMAKQNKLVGPFLSRSFHSAFHVAKRVRARTAIGTGMVSIGSIAVDIARRIFGDLSSRTILLLGAGRMAEAVAKRLGKGEKSIRVCNRNNGRAQALADSFSGVAVPWSELETNLTQADIVIVSTASCGFVISCEMVKRVMKKRRGAPLFFLDIAMPRNVDPQVHQLENVFVFNLEDILHQARQGAQQRGQKVVMAEAMIEEEVSRLDAWFKERMIQPTVVALRSKLHETMLVELEHTYSLRLQHLKEEDKQILGQMIESAINKFLHLPIARIKEGAKNGNGRVMEDVLRQIFDIHSGHPLLHS